METGVDILSFEREVMRLRPRLVAVACAMLHSEADADDAVQEALLKLWFFKQRLSEYNSIDAPAIVILRRVCINMLRSKARSPLWTTDQMPEFADSECPDLSLSDEMLQAIEGLPSTEQAVLRLKHIEGMEIDEIAALTQSNEGAVRTALSRARKRVRDRFITIYQKGKL